MLAAAYVCVATHVMSAGTRAGVVAIERSGVYLRYRAVVATLAMCAPITTYPVAALDPWLTRSWE